MCGFSGFIFRDEFPASARYYLEKMGNAIAARGPDNMGVWADEIDKIGLVHRRLSIVDLSPVANQPMLSRNGRYVIVYNGEIYNHKEVKSYLDTHYKVVWKGHSDTEILLTAIEMMGIDKTLKKLSGMFAFALWDKQAQCLYLARDRFGEKPLYYSQQDNMFIFGSELKSFRAIDFFNADISKDSISLLLRHNYIPAPYSIYKNVYKLLPGTYAIKKINSFNIVTYWDAKTYFNQAKNTVLSDVELISTLENKLKLAIKGQMLADVPVGAFLSGGIDSSLIVSLMQDLSDKPVKTFSIGFNEEIFNEAAFAKSVAEHLGTEHTELYVTAQDALKVVTELSEIYDEPFSDSSQIPTFLLAKMAKTDVKVSLSGDAGDELFAGYNRYLFTMKLWTRIKVIPRIIRLGISKIIFSISVKNWNLMARLLPARFRMPNIGDKLYKAAGLLPAKSIDEIYQRLISHWQDPAKMIKGAREPLTVLTDQKRKPQLTDPVEQMMALDTLSYLPDDILVKVDRAAMANSLETRMPFLDHQVFQHAWSMPQRLKIDGYTTKLCLRKILKKYIPDNLIERPKMGFGIPLADWLRGPLKSWAEKLLDENRLQEEGFFEAKKIVKMWQEHQAGEGNWQYHLWDVLMFQLWYEKHHK